MYKTNYPTNNVVVEKKWSAIRLLCALNEWWWKRRRNEKRNCAQNIYAKISINPSIGFSSTKIYSHINQEQNNHLIIIIIILAIIIIMIIIINKYISYIYIYIKTKKIFCAEVKYKIKNYKWNEITFFHLLLLILLLGM